MTLRWRMKPPTKLPLLSRDLPTLLFKLVPLGGHPQLDTPGTVRAADMLCPFQGLPAGRLGGDLQLLGGQLHTGKFNPDETKFTQAVVVPMGLHLAVLCATVYKACWPYPMQSMVRTHENDRSGRMQTDGQVECNSAPICVGLPHLID